MASSVNFAANLQELPSIFEINAAELLDKLLYPALSKVFNFFGFNYTIKLGNFKFTDDISPAIVIALQYLYISKRGGSFGESFYGLQRQLNLNLISRSRKKTFISATLLTLLPYFGKKLKERNVHHQSTHTEKILLKSINLFNILKMVFILLYLAKLTKTHSPLFKLLGLQLNYSPPSNDKITYWILRLIEIFAFFLQFTQWWYSTNQSSKIAKLENPPSFINSENNLMAQQAESKGICPICLQKFRNPTASGISGYVFCWKCIISHLKNTKHCPVTEFPMDINDLIRIYED